MRQSLAVPTGVVMAFLLFVPLLQAEASWTKITTFDDWPNADGWTKVFETTANESLSGGVYSIEVPPDRWSHYWHLDDATLDHTGWTVETRFRSEANQTTGDATSPYNYTAFGIADGVTGISLVFPKDGYVSRSPTHFELLPHRDWSQWHTMRVTGTPNSTNPDYSDVKVYVDGTPVGDYLASGSYAQQKVNFGDTTRGEANGPPLIQWDYLAYSAEGAFSPDELPTIPEPSTLTLAALGLLLLVYGQRRKR